MILGLRNVTRHRYDAGTWGADGRFTQGVATDETVQASVDVAPMSEWALDESGRRARRTIDLVSWADFREVDAGERLADRVTVDGRTYEVLAVTRMDPFEGATIAHYETRAAEVRGSDVGAP